MIPLIINTVHYKKLMVDPNERSSHSFSTPTLGGVAFFASLVISIFLIRKFDDTDISMNILAALTILFFLGLKDDLMVLSSKTKIILQTAAIFFIILNPEILFDDFHGFMGVNSIPVWLGIPISYLTILYIINAYNLIDGIDGLAGMLGILITTIFAILFFFIDEFFYSLLAISIVGFLVAFLRYNLSKEKKIFMGDTGSMVVGFLIGLLTLRFLALESNELLDIYIQPENLFIVTLAILFFPVIDVIRVIIVRLINGRGAFSADRCHLHHIFIDKGLSHVTASKTLTISGLISFLIIFFANNSLGYIGLMILFIILTFITFYLLLLLDKDETTKKHRKKMKTYLPEPVYRIEFRIRKTIIVFLKKMFFKDLL
jgi:UDP-N-acetylmuramyl pentapeptide phosphotransferase/UDP-N-acetylglucosamine-1-phosphate transferase